MNLRPAFSQLFAIGFAVFATGCVVHTPPGTSVEVALAKRPELVRLPAPPPSPASVGIAAAGVGSVEPALPQIDKTGLVAEAYSRGQFCMQAGKDLEAIAAFQEAVKIEPGFADGWTNLAMLYEKAGQEKEAMEAFRKAKTLAQH